MTNRDYSDYHRGPDELPKPKDITPQHTARAREHKAGVPGVHPQVDAAYAYVNSILKTADISVGGAPAWYGWAIREAFLAGCSYAGQA